MPTFDFPNCLDKRHREKMVGEIYSLGCEAEKLNKVLVISEGEIKKSYPQLKAIYKLFQLAQPHFQRWKPKIDWTLREIKEFSKAQLGYTRDSKPFEIGLMLKSIGFDLQNEDKKEALKWCNRIKQNISFADFTKEQAFNFAKEFEVWAQTPDKETKKDSWSDVYLTNEGREAYLASLEKYYK